MSVMEGVFVHALRVGTDRAYFVSFTESEVEAYGCGICRGRPVVATFYKTIVPDQKAIDAGIYSSYAEFFVCGRCDGVLRSKIGLERLVQHATGDAFRGQDSATAVQSVGQLALRERLEVRYLANDFRFGNTTGLQARSLGVSGYRRDGTPRDCHEWLLNSEPIPLLNSNFRPAMEFMRRFRQRYAYAVPNAAALEAIAAFSEGRPILEIGAGAAYWAYLLQQRGVHVEPFDVARLEGKKNTYWSYKDAVAPQSWTAVAEGDVHVVPARSATRTLMLIWPPENDAMAYDALRLHRGDRVVFVGKTDDDTGSKAFFELLAHEWDLAQTLQIPTFYFMGSAGDAVYCYRRR